MMYLQTLLAERKKPTVLAQHFCQHFFKPYENASAFTQGLFYPLEALFEETLPNLILSLHFIGQALISASATLGSFFLAQKKNAMQEKNNTTNALLLSALTLLTAFVAPIFEAIRFFTRWGATLGAGPCHQVIEKAAQPHF